eukprot:c9531_g1_i1.p1 GENE.c9531_g1_i1~~c9531_g1_i1.p1  ORF type:complete len:463 (-),score=106.58 c9531_g1_i1:136-1524(-)
MWAKETPKQPTTKKTEQAKPAPLSLENVFVGMTPSYWPCHDLPFLLSLTVEEARTYIPPALPGLERIHKTVPKKDIDAVVATMNFKNSEERLDKETERFYRCAQKRQPGAPNIYRDLVIIARTHIDCVNRSIAGSRDRLSHDPQYPQLLKIPEFSKPEVLQDKFVPAFYFLRLFWACLSGITVTISLVSTSSQYSMIAYSMPLWKFCLQRAPYFRSVVGSMLRPYLRHVLSVSAKVNDKLQSQVGQAVKEIEGAIHHTAPVKKIGRAQQKLFFDYLPDYLEKIQWAHPEIISNRMYCVFKNQKGAMKRKNAFMKLISLLLCPFNLVYGILVWIVAIFVQTFFSIPFIMRQAGPACSHIADGARAIVVCSSITSCLAVHEKLLKDFTVVRVKNRWKTAEEGYVDTLYNIRLDNVVCEVQVTHSEIYSWRSKTHKPYKVLRADNWEALFSDLKKESNNNAKHNP